MAFANVASDTEIEVQRLLGTSRSASRFEAATMVKRFKHGSDEAICEIAGPSLPTITYRMMT